MICKKCGRQLQNASIEKCPHCGSNSGFTAQGNGFYDILAKSASTPAAASGAPAAGDSAAARDAAGFAKAASHQATRNEALIKLSILVGAFSALMAVVILIVSLVTAPRSEKEVFKPDASNDSSIVENGENGGVEKEDTSAPENIEITAIKVDKKLVANTTVSFTIKADEKDAELKWAASVVTDEKNQDSVVVWGTLEENTVSFEFKEKLGEGSFDVTVAAYEAKEEKAAGKLGVMSTSYELKKETTVTIEDGKLILPGEALDASEVKVTEKKDGDKSSYTMSFVLKNNYDSVVVGIGENEFECKVNDKTWEVALDKAPEKDSTLTITARTAEADGIITEATAQIKAPEVTEEKPEVEESKENKPEDENSEDENSEDENSEDENSEDENSEDENSEDEDSEDEDSDKSVPGVPGNDPHPSSEE